MGLFAPEAAQDLKRIFDFIYEDSGSFDIASRYIDDIENLCRIIQDQPFIGLAQNDIAAGVRRFTIHSHIIFYRVLDEQVQVVRVLHGRRDITEQYFKR